MPDKYDIPVLIEGSCAIVSKHDVTKCDAENEKFKQLLRDAHLEVSPKKEIKYRSRTAYLSIAEINKLCDDFADSENIPMALKEFDIENFYEKIDVGEEFKSKLKGVLTDIKSIWFALGYDIIQFAKNTGDDIDARFKRYIYINNIVVRIRALWERLIGLAVLLERPHDYDKIFKAQKVRRKFIKEFKDSKHLVSKYIWDYLHSIDIFERRFRTPEIHKIGRTIRWATRENPSEEVNRPLAHYNDLNILLREIVKEFKSS